MLDSCCRHCVSISWIFYKASLNEWFFMWLMGTFLSLISHLGIFPRLSGNLWYHYLSVKNWPVRQRLEKVISGHPGDVDFLFVQVTFNLTWPITGRPPSVHVAIVVIESGHWSFVLNRRKTDQHSLALNFWSNNYLTKKCF